ncbi:unnamed protein product [Gongylonema pulchrum]|uniref:Peptidase_M13 domain-containing protein n=1 Tax=Gongylonema pulchrum TaxID=637853 RepID=A0A183EGW6_9BILA|nr:unnamed protein product [Gongylonema pulchrum]
MNYGAIGAVIGHEITHGFDDTGRRYNAVGELDDWWDNKTLGQFMELKKCFVEQYGSIVEPGTGGLKSLKSAKLVCNYVVCQLSMSASVTEKQKVGSARKDPTTSINHFL